MYMYNYNNFTHKIFLNLKQSFIKIHNIQNKMNLKKLIELIEMVFTIKSQKLINS